jgi:methylmalonyl-CoA/ethylmalonyl-CoA epimerase
MVRTDAPPSPETWGCRFHHVGFVVASIQDVASGFAQSIGAAWDGEIVHDSLQLAKVAFLRTGLQDHPALELVEPVGDQSPVHGFLRRGGGLHHLCYEADVLEIQLAASRSLGGLLVKPPLPAVAFGGRRIAWVYTRHKLLLEYLER